MIQYLPPQEPQFEKAILGAILVDKKGLPQVKAILSADDFYIQAHKDIYRSVLELDMERKPIDILSVSAQLKKTKRMDMNESAFMLAEMSSKSMSAINIEYNARVVVEKSMLRKQIQVAQEIIKSCHEPDADPFALISMNKSQLSAIERYDDDDYTPKTRMKETWDSMELASKNDGMAGIPTGIQKLDRFLGGITAGDYYVFSARSGSFKSALMLWIQHSVDIMGHPTLMFQQEMTKVQTGLREIALKSGLSTQDLKRGRIADYDKVHKAIASVERSNVFIDTSTNQTLAKIKAKAQRYIEEYGIRFIVIDYLNLCDLEIKKFGSEEQAIAHHVKEMKAMAKELNIAVLELVQFNKEATKEPLKPPSMSMIKGSGAIEFSADVVCFFWNPAKYDENFVYDDGTQAKGKIAIIVAKNKNGETGLFWHGVKPESNQFFELENNYDADKHIAVNYSFDDEKNPPPF
jgi:replicative DNA helicase